MNRYILVAVLVLVAACGQTSQVDVSYPFVGEGSALHEFDVGTWRVTLTRADVAIGPVYFCAASGASQDLCPRAVQEFPHDAVIDALSAVPQNLGFITGVSGAMRSVKYDLGISWPITSSASVASASAPSGHSVLIEGTAVRGAEMFSFVAEIDIVPSYQGAYAILGQRVDATVEDSGQTLTVSVAPGVWLSHVDFDALADLGLSSVRIADGFALNADGSTDARQRARDVLVLQITNAEKPMFAWTTGE